MRARSKRFSEILPSSKQMALKPTHPTDRLSSSNGLKPSPITTSVDPPPMSITSRLSGLIGLVCTTPGVDQARLFQPGDDFDGMTERGAGALQEPALALGAAQGIGADHAHAVGVHGAQPLPEAFEAAQCALGRRVVQPAAVAQARGQSHHLAETIQNDQLAVRITRDDHVKAVGAQIDGGEHVGNDTAAAHLRSQHS